MFDLLRYMVRLRKFFFFSVFKLSLLMDLSLQFLGEKKRVRERDRDRDRERKRERQRETGRQRKREIERERETERETERQRTTERDTDREREREGKGAIKEVKQLKYITTPDTKNKVWPTVSQRLRNDA